MDIIIRTVPSEIYLQTVSITHNKKTPDNMYLFRCYHCGTSIAQIKGDVAGISSGYIPTDQVPVIYSCWKCRENYNFQTIKTKSERIKLTVVPQVYQDESVFRCVICRNICFHFGSVEIPYKFTCPNYTCYKKYILNDVVSFSEVL